MKNDSLCQRENLTDCTINNPTPKPKDSIANKIIINKFFWIRMALMVSTLIFLFINTLYGFVLPSTTITCIRDLSFELTDGVNKYLNENKTALYVLLISSSICIDLITLIFFTNFICYANSWRIFIAGGTFYGVRAFIQVKQFINFRLFFKLITQRGIYGRTRASLH
jgi:hypothetical protein